MAVVQADGVHLLFVALDAVGAANVVTEDPGLRGRLRTSQAVDSAAGEERRADCR